jgi:hypothetical protein
MMKNDEVSNTVIGIILMIVIAILLAAVLSAFVFGMAAKSGQPIIVTKQITIEKKYQDPAEPNRYYLTSYNDNTRYYIKDVAIWESLPFGKQCIIKYKNDSPQCPVCKMEIIEITSCENSHGIIYKGEL